MIKSGFTQSTNRFEYHFVGPNKENKTISSALEKMNKGDVCVVSEGIYREELLIKQDSITIIGRGKVIINGCEKMGNLKATKINGQEGLSTPIKKTVYEVFQGDDYFHPARFPNKTYPMTSNQDWLFSYIASSGKISLQQEEKKLITDLYDGYYIGLHGRFPAYHPGKLSSWYSISAPVLKLDESDSIIVDTSEASSGYLGHYGIKNGVGYIIGAKSALDMSGEWWSDGKEVVLIPKPEQTNNFEFRVRLYGATITSNHVTLKNIHFVAASAKVEGHNVSFQHCAFEHISPFQHNKNDKPENKKGQSLKSCWGDPENGTAGVYITGNHFLAQDCRFYKSWWSGMTIRGNNALIENCLFENMNWMAKRSAALFSWGDSNTVRFCTFRNLGGAAIEGGNARWINQYSKHNVWEYNYIEGACKLIVDQGFFYVNHQSGDNPPANSIWRYNVGNNSRGPIKGDWTSTAVGYYVDNSSSGYLVHNNIAIDVNEGLRFNDSQEGVKAGTDVWFFNNTFYKIDKIGFDYFNGNKDETPVVDADVHFVNNLAVMHKKAKTTIWPEKLILENNFESQPSSVLKSPDTLDFTPVDDVLINSGITVKGKEYKYIGAVNPEKGMWIYGADESRLP